MILIVPPTVQGSQFATPSTSVATSPTGFQGLNQNNIGSQDPPDVAVAAGPNHVMEVVNRIVAIYNKQGSLLNSTGLDSFFHLASNDWTYDSRVLFDNLTRTWFATTDESALGGVRIAVSNTQDPTQGWHYYMVGGTMIRCYDQPKIGLSSDKVVITADAFLYSNPMGNPLFSCLGATLHLNQYWVLNKTDMVRGATLVHNTTVTSLPSSYYGSMQPMQTFSPINTIYLESTGPSAALSNVTVVTINGVPPGTVTNSSTTIRPTAPASPLPSSAATPRPNGYGDVNLLDGVRTQSVAWFQDRLWSTYMVGCTPPGDNTTRSCIQMLELNTSTPVPIVIQNFDYAARGQYYFYPALSIDGFGGVDMIFGYSNSTTYPAIALSGLAFDDPLCTMTPRLTVHQSNDAPAANRYGDYFTSAPDPSDPTLAWTGGEYISNTGGNGWYTFISSERLLPHDFTISGPNYVNIQQAAQGSPTLNIFSGTSTNNISLTSSTPSGLTASFNPSSVSLGVGSLGRSTLTLTVADTLAIGNYTLTVTATSGSYQHSLTIIVAISNFYQLVSPTVVGIPISGSGFVTITEGSENGYRGTAEPFIVSGMPSCVSYSFNPPTVQIPARSNASIILTLNPRAGCSASSNGIAVQSDSGVMAFLTAFRLNVTDFSISANPTSLLITKQNSGQSIMTLQSLDGFAEAVTLTASISPTGSHSPTTSLSLTSISLSGSGTSTLTVSTTSNTTKGIYTVSVKATSGSITHTAVISLTVS